MAVDSSYNFIALTGKKGAQGEKGEKGDSGTAANYLGILNSLPESASVGDYFTAGEITRVDTTTTTTTTITITTTTTISATQYVDSNDYYYFSKTKDSVYTSGTAYYSTKGAPSSSGGIYYNGNEIGNYILQSDGSLLVPNIGNVTLYPVYVAEVETTTSTSTADPVITAESSTVTQYLQDASSITAGVTTTTKDPVTTESTSTSSTSTTKTTVVTSTTANVVIAVEITKTAITSWEDSDGNTYTTSFVYTYTSSGTWEETDDIKNIDVFSDIVSLANSANNATAVQIVKRLVASDIFVENLATQKILFQNYVASISSSTTPESGDMMIYMGKNPKNFTADSEYQFAISKFIGQIGSSEMWKDMLKTKILASGLLSLMITGCVNPTDGVKQEDLTTWQESNLFDLCAENSTSYIYATGEFNDKFYELTGKGHLFYTDDYITFTEDTNFYNSVSDIVENNFTSFSYFSAMATYNDILYIVLRYATYKYMILSYDGETVTQELTVNSGAAMRPLFSYWKSEKILFSPICTAKSASGIYTIKLYYNNGSNWSSIELESSSTSYGICDDYVVFGFSDEYLKVWDGSSITSVVNPLYGDGSVTPVFISNLNNNDFFVKKGSGFYEVYYDDESMNFSSEKIIEDDSIISLSTPKTAISSNGIYFSNNGASQISSVLYFYNFKTKTIKQIYSNKFEYMTMVNDIVFCSDSYSEGTNYDICFSKDNGETWTSCGLTGYKKNFVELGLSELGSANTSVVFRPNGCFYISKLDKFVISGTYDSLPAIFTSTTTELFSAVSTLQSNVSTAQTNISTLQSNAITSYSLGTSSSYIKFANGLLIQWGKDSNGCGETNTIYYKTITLPLSYTSSSSYVAVVSGVAAGSSANHCCSMNSQSKQSFSTCETYNNQHRWITIGY